MDPTIKKRLLQTGAALLVVLLAGTFGYYLITGGTYDLFTCFYMTVITITTIGFDEIIGVKNFTGGRVFTVFLAFAGIGMLTYFVSSISAIIIEGHLKESYIRRKMEKTISKYHDHYIICGVGTHSLHLIDELVRTERESVFIEINSNVIRQVMKKYPMQKYVEGDATHDDILLKAGVERAKGLFASTSDDNLNLVICLSARRLNHKLKIVSICINPTNQDKIKIAGADSVVSPNFLGGMRMASEMLRPNVTNVLDLMLRDTDRNFRFDEVSLPENCVGKKMGALKLNEFKDTLIIAVSSKGEMIFKPSDDYEIKQGDSLIVMTTPKERLKLENIEV